jgi:putative transposase
MASLAALIASFCRGGRDDERPGPPQEARSRPPGSVDPKQCLLLSLARSGVYRPPAANDDADLALTRRLEELFMAWPFLGSRRMTALLRAEGARVNRKRVQRLMRLMGIAALGPKPRTSKPAPKHKVFPYLLRGLAINRPNQVWCSDITYIPIGRGFLS